MLLYLANSKVFRLFYSPHSGNPNESIKINVGWFTKKKKLDFSQD